METKRYLTLQDVASQTNDGRLANIVSEFKEGLTIFKDAPWKEASHIDKDEGIFLKEDERLTQTSPLSLGDGLFATKSGYYKRISSLGKIGTLREFDEETLKAVPDSGIYLEREIANMMRAMGNDAEYSILNTSQAFDPRYPEGLLPRFSVLTNIYGEILDETTQAYTSTKTPYVCLDALGAKTDTSRDGKLSSVLIVFFDDVNGVSLLYPRGSRTIGFDYRVDSDYSWTKNTDGAKRRELNAACYLTYGIAVNNSLACTRIANVDPDDETSMKTMMNLLFDAYERMDNYMKSSVRIFTTAQVVSAVRRLQYKTVYHTTLTGIQALNLKGQVVVDNDVFTTCHNMLHTEGRIKGAI